jgi:hypothetical protein
VNDDRLAVKLKNKDAVREIVRKNEEREVGGKKAVLSLEKWCGKVLYGMSKAIWEGEGDMEKLTEFLKREW